jgi:ribose transport system substrate-binding protein
MMRYGQHRRIRGWTLVCLLCLGVAVGTTVLAISCGSSRQELIAVIPETDGMMLWDAAHTGAEKAASHTGSAIYWNAPMREDDVAAQVRLIEQVVSSKRYQGLVIAPTQALSVLSPVRRALSQNIPTVIIDTPLSLPPGGNLSYILNDEEEGARLAAERVARLLQGRGNVALLGINPDILGVTTRARVFEQTLAAQYPDIHVIEKRMGSFNILRERQVAEEFLASDPDVDVCVALLWTTLNGLFSAIDSMHPRRPFKIVAFDIAADPPFQQRPNLDCIIQADTKEMGRRAVELIHAKRRGQSVPAEVLLKPRVITRNNLNSPEIRQMMSFDWSLGRWAWSSTP